MGILLMLLGMFLYVSNDVLGKWLVATYTVGQILLLRSTTGFLLLVPSIMKHGVGAVARPQRPGLHVVRAILLTGEVAAFYWAASLLPLADVVTFYMATPIFVAALAGPLLKEKLDWQRWVAILLGFAGVVISLRPSSSTLAWPALIAIGGCFAFSLSLIVTRTLREAPSIVLVTWQNGAALLFGIIVAPWNWVPPTWPDFLLMCLLGIVATFAHLSMNKSLKLAPASAVAPYQYTQIAWAMVLGFIVFGDIPDLYLIMGSGVIVIAGLLIYWREQHVGNGSKSRV
ncbi:MAG: DMT family transporter [Hyphomicrobiales bacterium]